MKHVFDYVIVGGGLAGASAVEGIRELDESGSILLICEKNHLPYDRSPLPKKLWFGKMKVEDIFLHGHEFYDKHAVTLRTTPVWMNLLALFVRPFVKWNHNAVMQQGGEPISKPRGCAIRDAAGKTNAILV